MTVAIAVAAMAAGGATWCLVPGAARMPRSGGSGRWTHGVARWLLGLGMVGAVVVLGLLATTIAGGLRLLPWVVMASTVAVATALLAFQSMRRRSARRAGDEVARACQVFAGQLRIGQIPVQALAASAEDCPALEEVVAAQRMGADVPAALRMVARTPGRGGLAHLAAAWQLSERSGAPMASTAEEVARGLAQVVALRRSVAAELAPARATGKLLAGLPVVGIALGFTVGGSPDEFLLRTTLGNWALALGVVLACVGVLWTEALADRIERRTR